MTYEKYSGIIIKLVQLFLHYNFYNFCFCTVNFALSSMTSYPSTVGVIGLSSPSSWWLPAGSDKERGQLEYSTEGSKVPFTRACVTGLGRGGGVWLRPPLSVQRDWRWDLPNPPPWSSLDPLGELLETLPNDEARCGRLGLLLPLDKTLSMGTGTGTKGDAILLTRLLLPRHGSGQWRAADRINDWWCINVNSKHSVSDDKHISLMSSRR